MSDYAYTATLLNSAAAALASHSAARLEESSRKAEALAQIEDDREKVRARVERERLAREARQRRESEAGVSEESRHHEVRHHAEDDKDDSVGSGGRKLND